MIFFIGIISAIFYSGGTMMFYIDIPIIIFIGIFPLIFVSIIFSFKEVSSAFSVPFKKEVENDKLIKALDFFKIYGKTAWIAGFIAVLIGLVAILMNLEDRMKLGPNLALALISLLYCGIINIIIIIPYTVFIKRKLKV
jgi:flagellar motor component MotA